MTPIEPLEPVTLYVCADCGGVIGLREEPCANCGRMLEAVEYIPAAKDTDHAR